MGALDAPAPNAVVEISVGGQVSCVRLGSGSVWCWGNGNEGGLGDNTMAVRGLPGPTLLAVPAVALSTNDGGTCALTADGAAWCWGFNGVGQLGVGDLAIHRTPTLVPVPTSGIVELEVGNQIGCIRRMSGQVACAGSSNHIGITSDNTRFIDIPGLSDAIALTGGDDFACALRANGSVACFGKNFGGEFGNGTQVPSETPVPGPAGPYSVISAGDTHVCALRNGRVDCWGINSRGQLGTGMFANSFVPVEVAGIDDAVQLATSADSTCVLHATGIVDCFGADYTLGDGSLADRAAPGPIPLDDIVEIDAHTSLHICARRRDATVWCWGGNGVDQIGAGGSLPAVVRLPTQVIGLP